MAKKYICNACNTLCDETHKFEKAWSLCTGTPPCTRIRKAYCGTCNSWSLRQKCFQNHVTLKVKGKLVCQWRQLCQNCSFTVTNVSKHLCFKKCNYFDRNQPSGHFCYVAPLRPNKITDRFLYVFFDTECTHDLQKHGGSFVRIPNLICAQEMCSKYEAVDDVNVDCEQCGYRTHVFRQDPVVKFIDYLRQSRPFPDKIYIFTYNSLGYDAQFLLLKFLEMWWTPQLIMDGTKILSMVVENLYFLDSLHSLAMSLKSMPKERVLSSPF